MAVQTGNFAAAQSAVSGLVGQEGYIPSREFCIKFRYSHTLCGRNFAQNKKHRYLGGVGNDFRVQKKREFSRSVYRSSICFRKLSCLMYLLSWSEMSKSRFLGLNSGSGSNFIFILYCLFSLFTLKNGSPVIPK